MKFSVSSYSFMQYIMQGKLDQLSCIDQAAKMGFDAIEFIDLYPPEGTSIEDFAKKIVVAAKDAGIGISSYTVGADFLNGSDKNNRAEIERIKKQVEVGAILGVNRMRHDATGGDERSFDEVLPILAASCREVTEFAEQFGIKTTVENHGFFCQDSERVVALYKAIDHKNFGLLCDMGNFLCADEAPEKAVRAVAPYAAFVHAKDFYTSPASKGNPGEGWFGTRGGNFLKGAIVGQGDVPVKLCIDILKEAGYNDTISLEYEAGHDCIEGIAQGLEFLRANV